MPPDNRENLSNLARVRQTAHTLWDGLRTRSRVFALFFGEPVDLSVTTAPGAAPPSQELKRLNVSSFEWTILRDPPRTYWLDVAWPLFGEYLGNIQAAAAAAHAPTVVMVIPQMGQFDEATRQRTMADFRFGDDEVDWDRPQRQLVQQSTPLGLTRARFAACIPRPRRSRRLVSAHRYAFLTSRPPTRDGATGGLYATRWLDSLSYRQVAGEDQEAEAHALHRDRCPARSVDETVASDAVRAVPATEHIVRREQRGMIQPVQEVVGLNAMPQPHQAHRDNEPHV